MLVIDCFCPLWSLLRPIDSHKHVPGCAVPQSQGARLCWVELRRICGGGCDGCCDGAFGPEGRILRQILWRIFVLNLFS